MFETTSEYLSRCNILQPSDLLETVRCFLMQAGLRYSQSFVQELLFLLQLIFQTLHFNLQLDVLEEIH